MKSTLTPSAFRIIVPCRDCGEYIDECLDSVLSQEFQDWTLLVVDDASEDDTEKRVEPYLKDKRIEYRRASERLYLMGNTVEVFGAQPLTRVAHSLVVQQHAAERAHFSVYVVWGYDPLVAHIAPL